jgi:integrase
MKGSKYYVSFRWKNQRMDTVTSATSMTEAKRIERAVRTAFRIYRFDHLDPASLEVVMRIFTNKGWKVPDEIGQPPPRQEPTLVQCLEDYLEADPRNRTERKLFAMDRLVEFFGDHSILEDISVARIKAYRRHRLARGVSNGTVNIEVSTLSGIFREQIERGNLEINPCSMVQRLPETQRDTYISWNDFNAMLTVSGWLGPILTMLYYTGMRPSEVFGLEWKEVNFQRRMMILSPRRTKEGKNPNRKVLREKRIPMRMEVYDLLWSMRHGEGGKVIPMNGLVFLHRGRPITRGTKRKRWARIVRLTGLEGVQMRDLRHTFKTNLALSGVDRTIRNAIVGHATRLPVEDLYIHIPDYKLLEAVDGMRFDHGGTCAGVVGEKATPE